MKLKFEMGTKIVHAIRRAVELPTSSTTDESQLSELVDILVHSEVTFPNLFTVVGVNYYSRFREVSHSLPTNTCPLSTQERRA
jgi:hypothetical protein